MILWPAIRLPELKFSFLTLARLTIFVLAVCFGFLQCKLFILGGKDLHPAPGNPLVDLMTHRPIEPVKNQPLLVVHVGPPKTGTTSLQHMIGVYEPQLMEDNYFFAGGSSFIDSFNICTRRMVSSPNVTHECWTNIFNATEGHRKAGHNFILSNEVLSLRANDEQYFDVLRRVIDPWMPNILVVVGYRHLHNFVHSTHYELQKNERWPSLRERGKNVDSFVKFWQANHGKVSIGPVPTPAAVMAHFRNLHYNVSVLDIETKEQISEFFCRVLPNASHTCQYHKVQPPFIPTLNTKDLGRVNYDSLALLAFEQKMFKKTQTRGYVRAKIKRFNERVLKHGPDDFVLKCLDSNQEEDFLQESMDHARAAGFYDLDDAIRSDFAKAKEKKKLCSINAPVVFWQEAWQAFFRGAKKW